VSGARIAFFPEAASGPALNSVAIAQRCRERGHEPVFVTDPGMEGTFEEYGFEERYVNMSEPMPPEEKAAYWDEFINRHIPNFDLPPHEQVDNYVTECWEAIVDTARWAQKELPETLDAVDPDLICLDNVVMFPAVKQHGVPWVRITSCAETEIPDPDIPPYLSGCPADDHDCFERFRRRYEAAIEPVHEEFNEFLTDHGLEPYPLGQFLEPSPYLNLILYPEPLQYDRSEPLDPDRYRYLEGCVRDGEAYDVPEFDAPGDDAPLVYLSFGSLGAGDTDLMTRLIEFLGTRPYRCLVNVGDYGDEYDRDALPANVRISDWFPQPSVIEQADAVIHHGGNNTTNECLYHGTPAVVMPYVWDGHDNATRVAETGHGVHLHRSDWTDDELADALDACLTDEAMRDRLEATARHMRAADGPGTAARLLDDLLAEHAG